MSVALISGVPTGIRKKTFLRKKREERSRASKVNENTKISMILHGKKTNQLTKQLLKDLHNMRKPHSVSFTKKNNIAPFDDTTPVSFLSRKNDASLFVVGHSTKKRPQTLVLGRCFNYQVMDMVEFAVENYSGVVLNAEAVQREGAKPCIIFQGDLWENNDDFKLISNLLTDFFKAERLDKISITGIDHALIFTVLDEETISMSHYGIQYSRSSDAKKGKIVQFPRIDLVDIGPSMNLKVSRSRFADKSLRNESLLIPFQHRHSKGFNKNVSQDELGDVYGRVHLQQQDIREIATRKFKSMKKSQKKAANALERADASATALRTDLDNYMQDQA